MERGGKKDCLYNVLESHEKGSVSRFPIATLLHVIVLNHLQYTVQKCLYVCVNLVEVDKMHCRRYACPWRGINCLLLLISDDPLSSVDMWIQLFSLNIFACQTSPFAVKMCVYGFVFWVSVFVCIWVHCLYRLRYIYIEGKKRQSIRFLTWPCYQGDTEILSMSQGSCCHGNTYEWERTL